MLDLIKSIEPEKFTEDALFSDARSANYFSALDDNLKALKSRYSQIFSAVLNEVIHRILTSHIDHGTDHLSYDAPSLYLQPLFDSNTSNDNDRHLIFLNLPTVHDCSDEKTKRHIETLNQAEYAQELPHPRTESDDEHDLDESGFGTPRSFASMSSSFGYATPLKNRMSLQFPFTPISKSTPISSQHDSPVTPTVVTGLCHAAFFNQSMQRTPQQSASVPLLRVC